jgi:hypothetical protein
MSGLGVVMGTSAAFVNQNPDVICSDNDQHNISINVNEGIPSLSMDNGDFDAEIYLDEEGALNLTDNLKIEEDGTITAPAWSIDASGNVTGNFVLPDESNLSVPHDVNTEDICESVTDIMEDDNFDQTFADWIINLQRNPTTYDWALTQLNNARDDFKESLLEDYPQLGQFNLNCRIVFALNDGTLYYDSNVGSNNTWANAKALPSNIGLNMNTRPCVMSTQCNDYDYTYETQTYFNYNQGTEEEIVTKEYFVATKINAVDEDEEDNQGGLGNNYGTAMYSFSVDIIIPIIARSSNPAFRLSANIPKVNHSNKWEKKLLAKK